MGDDADGSRSCRKPQQEVAQSVSGLTRRFATCWHIVSVHGRARPLRAEFVSRGADIRVHPLAEPDIHRDMKSGLGGDAVSRLVGPTKRTAVYGSDSGLAQPATGQVSLAYAVTRNARIASDVLLLRVLHKVDERHDGHRVIATSTRRRVNGRPAPHWIRGCSDSRQP